MRGYVQDGQILPPNPALARHAQSKMPQAPVEFSRPEQDLLVQAIQRAAQEFRYTLTDLSVESWHLHWIVAHGQDPVEVMVGRLKTRMRQALQRGRIWTEGYCHRFLYSESDLAIARQYIAKHPGCRVVESIG
jgi:REP element-mobilizing transposase RayT